MFKTVYIQEQLVTSLLLDNKLQSLFALSVILLRASVCKKQGYTSCIDRLYIRTHSSPKT